MLCQKGNTTVLDLQYFEVSQTFASLISHCFPLRLAAEKAAAEKAANEKAAAEKAAAEKAAAEKATAEKAIAEKAREVKTTKQVDLKKTASENIGKTNEERRSATSVDTLSGQKQRISSTVVTDVDDDSEDLITLKEEGPTKHLEGPIKKSSKEEYRKISSARCT